MNTKPLGLFEAFGVELEYMIVDRDTLRPLPLAEEILVNKKGATVNEFTLRGVGVSNELAAHVIEFKSAGPTDDLVRLERDFRAAIREINRKLAKRNAMLAPGGIHPFMDPTKESALWSKGNHSIYEAYDRIFNCHGHGWFNLQSCHLNLPFSNDDEFGRLHSAIILILPYLSALTASSPYMDGRHDGFLDTRLSVYSNNQSKIPEIAGSIVPEAVFSRATYEREILQKVYDAIAPLDPDGILQHEWLNSRGAIPRFDRYAIEIRVLDTQECPIRDIAICSFIIAVLETLCSRAPTELEALAQRHTPEERRVQFMNVARYGRGAAIDLTDIGDAFGFGQSVVDVGDLWTHLLQVLQKSPRVRPYLDTLQQILDEGSLAERMLAENGYEPSAESLRDMVSDLAESLATNAPYRARADA